MAKHFQDSDSVQVSFFARGANKNAIQENGLKVIHQQEEFVAFPGLISDHANDIGLMDYVFVCSKSYDLKNILLQLKPCINHDTIIIPLLNGVDHRAIIETVYPDNLVLDGCVYIVARLKQPGVVENSGNVQTMFFGKDGLQDERLEQLEKILRSASIDANNSLEMSKVIWEKFIFLSPMASATSYFDNTIGEILESEGKKAVLLALVEEVLAVCNGLGIKVSDDVLEKTHKRINSMVYTATSSMHADYRSGKPVTELETLTGYVVQTAKKLQIVVLNYIKVYNHLQGRD